MPATISTRSKIKANEAFNAQEFLDSAGVARKIVEFKKKETIFSQGEPAKNVFYIQKGGVRLSVLNEAGKEAVVVVSCSTSACAHNKEFDLPASPTTTAN